MRRSKKSACDGAVTVGLENLRLICIDDFCKVLKVSKAHFNDLRRKGKIIRPWTKLGRSPRWTQGQVAAWMRSGCTDPLFWKWNPKEEN